MGTIVIGVDGSPASKQALDWALAEARLRGSGVRVVQVWSLPIGFYGDAFAPFALGGETIEVYAKNAQDRLDDVLGAADTHGVEVERSVVQGPAAETLIEAADGAELLVVGSRGHGGFSGLLLGSVSQQCAHHAPCPVVIVRAR